MFNSNVNCFIKNKIRQSNIFLLELGVIVTFMPNTMKNFFIYLLFYLVVVTNAAAKKNESDLSFLYNTKEFFKNGTFTVGTGIHYYTDEHIRDAMASIMPLNFNIAYFINDISFLEFEYMFHAKNLNYDADIEFIQRFHNLHLKYRYMPYTFKSKDLHGLVIGTTFEFMKINTNYLPGGNHTQSYISIDAGLIFSLYEHVMLEAMYKYPVIYFDHTGELIKIKHARDASGVSVLLKYRFN